MATIQKKYRQFYAGEEIITERKYEFQRWINTVETVPSAVTNNQISNRAVVIGNGPNRLGFDLNNLKKPSGLLGRDTVQTYGCNALYRDFAPDFLIARGSEIVNEIASSGYTQDNIVYTDNIHLLEHPSKFYLVPYDPYADAGTTAAYIAAFDEHKKIYLLGFDGHSTETTNWNVYADTRGYDSTDLSIDDTKWIDNRKSLFDAYDDVDWVWVTPHGRNLLPETLKYCSNLRQISFRDLVLECDL